MEMSTLTIPIRKPSLRAAARVAPTSVKLGNELSGADVVLVPRIRVAGFCETHLLPFAGEVSVAQIPPGRTFPVRAGTVRRMLRQLCAQPCPPGRLAQSLADQLESGMGASSILVSSDLRHACGGCGAMELDGGGHNSVPRGDFRSRPDLAHSVTVFLRRLGRRSSDGLARRVRAR